MGKRDSHTGDLFDSIPQPVPAVPGGLDFRGRIAALLAEMLAVAQAREPNLDRYRVAAEVSRLVGKEVSKAMLDGYTAESRDAFNLPFWLIPAFEHVCSSTLLTEWLAGVRGGQLLLGKAVIDAEIGRRQSDIERAQSELRTLRAQRRRVG